MKPKFIMRSSVPHIRPKMNLGEVIHCAKENEPRGLHTQLLPKSVGWDQ